MHPDFPGLFLELSQNMLPGKTLLHP